MKKVNLLLNALLCLTMTANQLFADANVQVVHNSSDPAASVVDIYVNGNKPGALDNFNYREATPYIPLPDGTDIIVTIAGANSSDVNDQVIDEFNLGQLADGESYVVIANGIAIDEADYTNPAPSSRTISFGLDVIAGGVTANNSSKVDLKVFHGVTDAPAVDIYVKGAQEPDYPQSPQIPNLDYKASTPFIELDPASYNIKVTAAGDPNTVVGEYFALLNTAVGTKVLVNASGFLTTDDEKNTVSGDQSFALNGVIPTGNTFLLPKSEFANVQLIHNAADPDAEVVDIYINGIKPAELDDFSFRDATPYVPIPAETPLTVTVAGANSTDASDQVVGTFALPALDSDLDYVVVANGVLGQNFNSPDQNRNIAFDLYALGGNTEASSDDKVAINAWHGATDAPAVDIYTDINGEPFVPNLDYGKASDWTEVDNQDLTLTLTVAGDKSTVAGEFIAPLSAFGGQSLFVFASGFLTADDEPNMPVNRDFGLFVATASGDVVQLPSADPTAKVQVIHNAADPLAETVDVYVNGAKPAELDDFSFRDATSYLDVPANTSLTITIAAATSQGVEDQKVTDFEIGPLDADGEYVVLANGVLTGGFNSPDQNRLITFDLYPLSGNTAASSNDKVAINAWHGSTDAPAVDIYTDINGEPFVPGLDYGNASDWVEVDNQDLTLTLTVSGDKSAIAGKYDAPLSAFGSQSLFVFASGFLTADDEPNMPMGRDFGLFVATANGDVVQLPESVPTALVQVIHNSADPNAETVDVYINGEKPDDLDDFTFRTATEYLPVPANTSLTITIAGSSSTDVTDAKVADFELGPLDADGEYVVVANGVLGENFNNPDEANRMISFDLYPLAGNVDASSDEKVNIAAWHGVTDAPAVDIYVDIEGEPFIPNLDYGNSSGWVEVNNQDLELTLTVAGDKTAEVDTYDAPLSAFGGQSLFIFASGFLSAEDEPNMPMGRDFGLFVATSAGVVVQLSPSASIEMNNELTDLYPNPSQGDFAITSEKLFDKVRIVDMAGNEIYNEIMPNGVNNFDVPELNVGNGNYLVILYNAEEIISAKMQVINK